MYSRLNFDTKLRHLNNNVRDMAKELRKDQNKTVANKSR